MSKIDTYVCPVCHYGGKYTYMRCDHPGCPDGRDIEVREQADQRDPPGSSMALAYRLARRKDGGDV